MYKKVGMSEVLFLVLYVDNILLMENDISILQYVKILLSNNFSMKDLGEKIYRDRLGGCLVFHSLHT